MWTAILLAGQRPGIDPLAAAFGLTMKALIPVGGEAMVSRTARALLACPAVTRVLVLAQDTVALTATPGTAWLATDTRVTLAVSQAGIANSVIDVAGSSAPWPVLVTTADHVLLTPAMVADFLEGAGGADAAAAVVERRTIVDRFPVTRRTWLRFRGGAYSGANLFALGGAASLPMLKLWATVERDRKSGWRLLAGLGPGLAIGAALRLLTLEGAAARLGRRFGAVTRAVVLDNAEAAIDVDKLDDHRLAEAVLAAR